MARLAAPGAAWLAAVLLVAEGAAAGEPSAWLAPAPTQTRTNWGLLDLDRSLGSGRFDRASTLTGNWGGVRDRLERDHGVNVFAVYTSEVAGNPVGGLDRNVRYTHNVGVGLAADLGKLAGIPDTYFLVTASNRSGESNSALDIGNLFEVQQIYGHQTTRLVQLALGHEFLDGDLEVVAGRIHGLDDFAASPLYCNAQNLAFCGNPLSIPINVSIPSYPNAAWGARARYEPGGDPWYVMVGAYNAFENFRANKYHGVDFSWRSASGIVTIAEVGLMPHAWAGRGLGTDLPGHYKVGGYWGNEPRPVFATGERQRGTWSVYVAFDQMFFREGGEKSQQGLTGFVAVTWAPPERNSQELFLTSGLLYEGIVPGRDADLLGLYAAYGQISRDLRHSQIRNGVPGQTFELILEINYRVQVLPWLYLQPDVQGILNPGGAGRIDDALVFALQFGVPL